MPKAANPTGLLRRSHLLSRPISRARQFSRRCAFWIDMRLQPHVASEQSWGTRVARLRWIAENYLALRGISVATELDEVLTAEPPGVFLIDEPSSVVLATLASQTPLLLVGARSRSLMGLALRDLRLTADATNLDMAHRARELGIAIVFTSKHAALARNTAKHLDVSLTHLSREYLRRHRPRQNRLLAPPASYGR